jgi:hypothetical protein
VLETPGRHSVDGPSIDCVAFYASLPAADFDTLHVWRGPLSAVPELLEERGGPYSSSPTNLWPADRSWFIWTDYDLAGTKVSGSKPLVRRSRATPPSRRRTGQINRSESVRTKLGVSRFTISGICGRSDIPVADCSRAAEPRADSIER